MTSQFKIGDRVRVARNDAGPNSHLVGQEGIVTDVHLPSDSLRVDGVYHPAADCDPLSSSSPRKPQPGEVWLVRGVLLEIRDVPGTTDIGLHKLAQPAPDHWAPLGMWDGWLTDKFFLAPSVADLPRKGEVWGHADGSAAVIAKEFGESPKPEETTGASLRWPFQTAFIYSAVVWPFSGYRRLAFSAEEYEIGERLASLAKEKNPQYDAEAVTRALEKLSASEKEHLDKLWRSKPLDDTGWKAFGEPTPIRTQVTHTAEFLLPDGLRLEIPPPTGEGWRADEKKLHAFNAWIMPLAHAEKNQSGNFEIIACPNYTLERRYLVEHKEGVCWLHDMGHMIGGRMWKLAGITRWTRPIPEPVEPEQYDYLKRYPLLNGVR